ncbi:host specificity protein J [Pandoraea pnomenusa]|uniref:host specificity protein J n=1 Tax=Pandoraea pnomenusa TaxID=93220 RepID=UPI0007BCA29F|nr:host specificity protein J [Pandoraea pnomenusa]ANC42965.1 host specificity protein J [Pandoraea pnomenusa]
MKYIVGYGGGGGKGGGDSRTPTESPDSLHSIAYAKVLDAVSEGDVVGLVNGLQSVYLDGTPILNPDGTANFQNVSVDVRTGTQDQAYIPGFPAVESEATVGVTLTSAVPWVRAISNTQLSAVRITMAVPALSQANTSNGDITGYRVEYAIDLATSGGAFQEVLSSAFDGKTTSTYERSHRINLPASSSGWTIRVRRITPNANSSTIADTTNIESIAEIIDAKLRYPNTALVGIQVDARQFKSIPTRSFDMKGRIIRVPSNYDPASRSYSGTWDGTFKSAWSDNPAWVFYDLVLHPRYGLGHRVNAAQVDKWSLYQIGQYCDELVDDGNGGREPRFACNCYLQSRADAYKVLQDLATIFRGMAYWANGNVVAVADMPGDPVYSFTNANVINGKFTYTGTSWKARKTVALVTWNDPSDFYKAKVEYVEDQDGISRYGVQQTETTAFGCASQGQAQRVGHWTLLSSRLETESVSFSVGLEEAMVSPGSVVSVADASRAGRRIGGRVRSAAGPTVVLDKVEQIAVGDTLTVILPSGARQSRTVQSVEGNAVTVTANWTEAVQSQAIWVSESAQLKTQLFRVLSISQGDGLQWDVSAIQHNPDKYAAIDSGTRLQQRPISVIPPSVQPPAKDVLWDSYSVIAQGIASTTGVIKWTPADKAIAYEVEWRRDNGEWVKAGRTGSQSLEVPNLYAGTYVARVTALNALDVPSIPAYSPETVLSGKTSPPPTVTSLLATGIVFGIQINWGFPTGPLDVERTEVWYSQTDDRASAIKLADFAFPQNTHTMMGLAAGATFFFWARLIDKSGNVGSWYPATNGVMGQASANADDILEYLNGKIGETQLSQDLLEAIATIQPPFAGSEEDYAGSVNIYAGILSVQSLIQDGDRAVAQQVTTLQATVGENTALVQTNAQALASLDGKVSASYQMKVGVTSGGKYYGAGIGIGVSNETGPVQSQILFLADRFAFLNTANDQVSTPFVIQNGQTFISQAFIGNGWITNAMIGDYIQSNNYQAGVSGWRLDKSGTLYMNGGASGQGRVVLSPNGISVYDANNVLRVRLGLL